MSDAPKRHIANMPDLGCATAMVCITLMLTSCALILKLNDIVQALYALQGSAP